MFPKKNAVSSNACVICGLKTTFGCSKCRQAYYCSSEHQKQHWSQHQSQCNKQQVQEQAQDQERKPTNIEQVYNEKDHLQEDLERYRQIAIRLISLKEYQDAVIPIKRCIDVTSRMDPQRQQEYYEQIANYMLLGRVYINLTDFENARKALNQGYQFLKMISQQIHKKEDVSKVTNMFQVLAQQFYQTGDQKNCELVYVDYVGLIEKHHGERVRICINQSLSTGNAYFLVGVYYLQHKSYTQALACFKRTLNIRMITNEQDEGIADCWYNIGVVYKQLNRIEQAIEFIEKALKMRRQLIGDQCMQVAICLEVLGKIHIQTGELRTANNKLQECLAIRKFLIKDPNHPEIERVSKLIQSISRKSQEVSQLRQQPQLMSMIERMQITINDNQPEIYETSDPFTLEQSSLHSDIIKKQKERTPKNITPILKKKQSEDQTLQVSAQLLESLTMDQIIYLRQLNDALTKVKRIDHAQYIQDSDFLNSLSSIQVNMVREMNPLLFQTNEDSWSDDGSEEQDKLGESNLKVRDLLQQNNLMMKGTKYIK